MYINGRPYVLRESARPFKNMQEYTGIDADRLELMEMRLKVRLGEIWPMISPAPAATGCTHLALPLDLSACRPARGVYLAHRRMCWQRLAATATSCCYQMKPRRRPTPPRCAPPPLRSRLLSGDAICSRIWTLAAAQPDGAALLCAACSWCTSGRRSMRSR